IFTVLRRANKYIDETMPWVLAKDESQKDRLATVLYNLTETIVICASLLAPFMPSTSQKVVEQCGTTLREYADLDKFGLLQNGTKVAENPAHLFARIDVDKVKKDLLAKGIVKEDKPEETSEKPETKEGVKEEKKEDKKAENIVDLSEITIEDFAKIQLRVGKILTAEKVEKADKLLKFSVQIGDDIRTIVSGIAKHYTPEETIGKNVVVVYNLKPAKLRGIESQGMLLCACFKKEDGSEEVVLVSPEKPVESGSVVR
ncbi:MAG TPA: methionine--tRNA ligase subunit beta, partial [Clostridiales bacterium]|nr:methionine--tRNA ligase subunit beta [Clostridiales bacterium]